ncbi:TetR/AcrR family transcriptional regulator [Arthrobacter sp. UM1]|uniref:TetR/AcrR family transcriptional regulator n=1 Tax=Arthrobacter sp. UM1 TaxID=2766776 RepID=UPI001CF6CC97|nr:TetR/AcrR family transcriptional regulator [Arthrobacter sp. UM1]MCB4207729.1 TetR/AcrR family transcriptional regulator [Arthrobacter sp. UM1]
MPKITEERREEQRSRILSAAMATFAEHGFRGASMARIIKASGLSAGAIYTYFPTKDSLEHAVAESIFRNRLGALRELAESDPVPAPAEGVRRFVASIPAELMDTGLLLQIWGEAVSEDRFRELSTGILRGLVERMGEYLAAWLRQERGLDEAASRERGRRLAPAVVALCQGYILRRALSGEGEEAFLGSVDALLQGL